MALPHLGMNQISPDSIVYREWGPFVLNATIAYTWIVMVVLTSVSWFSTRNLTSEKQLSRWQSFLEVVVSGIRDQIHSIGEEKSDRYLPFIGSLFLFIAVSNFLTFIPGYIPPTASLSTTAALAISVFFAVPVYGIASEGIVEYLKHYFRPTPFMFPFEVLGEVSRTLALAIRLFGNVMSEIKVVAILLAISPFIFPVLMDILGMLTGLIQAYIFAVLAMVYIASATRAREE